jgi:hypothetical protein
VEPIDDRRAGTLRRVAPTDPAQPAAEVPGIDVSWPQCGDALPEAFGFAIVGVNGGRVYSPNPCLAAPDQPSQLAWAGPEADLYVNTANPGPSVSSYWPHGQALLTVECDTAARPGADSAECAYLYGWNAAADSYRIALEAFKALGWAEPTADTLPGERTWWLDVETANTWRWDWSFNVASLQGAVDYLEAKGVTEVGFYSTPLLWWQVTGGSQAFAAHPAWHAGGVNRDDAIQRCASESAFTGGELRMVQWVEDGLDRNHRC